MSSRKLTLAFRTCSFAGLRAMAGTGALEPGGLFGLPRRLLVSPRGVAHMPNCRRVPATAEADSWGELVDVAAALQALVIGTAVLSSRAGRKGPGPIATTVCGRCLEHVSGQGNQPRGGQNA